MLIINIPDFKSEEIEYYNEETEEFITQPSFSIKGQNNIQLEHSLMSLHKWEKRWKKPFLSNVDKTTEETLDYIKCMTITQNVRDEIYNIIPDSVMTEIRSYIDDPMTATTFSDRDDRKQSKEVLTAELIYYYMIALQIPIEFQKWHLNSLTTLIKVCSLKNQPEKKMSKKEIMARNRALNAQRRAQHKTRG